MAKKLVQVFISIFRKKKCKKLQEFFVNQSFLLGIDVILMALI